MTPRFQIQRNRSARKKRAVRLVHRSLKSQFYPFSFFVRNLMTLQEEKNWRRLSLRVRKEHLLRMLFERSSFFIETQRWVRRERGGDTWIREALALLETRDPSQYCTHCGICCEIASGYPEFPLESALSPEWRGTFGNGLGKGHRFCGFLWELERTGKSLCSVHPHRSNPCRAFERDECDNLKHDPEFLSHPGPGKFFSVHRRLVRLMNR